MKRKILFVASVYAHLAAFHKPFIKLFQEKGYEVHAAGSASLNRKEELQENGVICHDVNFDRMPFSQKNTQAVRDLQVLLKQNYFDLIHVHTPTAAFLTRFIASKNNQGKVLYTAHGFHFFNGASRKSWLLYYSAEKIARRWTDGLLVMNEEDFTLGERIGFKKDKNLFYVHGVGVDLNEFHKGINGGMGIKNELGFDVNSVVISCIAELSARKNQMFLLENWNMILEKCPNAQLLLVGEGNDLTKLTAFIKEHGIMNVHLLGYRSDVPSIIASSDIITLVSKQEGLPRCLMEAMACAKPILTTNVRGSRDLVENKKNGILVNLEDREQLVKGFITLIQDENIRIKYGKIGEQKIKNYSLPNIMNVMDDIYSRFL